MTAKEPQIRVRYLSTEVDEVHPLVLDVAPGGAATLWVGSNADAPGQRPVGQFAGTLPAAELAALQEALDAQAFRGVKDPEGLAPGTPLRELTRSVDGVVDVSRAATGEAPPPFAAAEARVRALAARLAASPTRALALRLASAEVDPRSPRILDLVVELRNAGPRPLAVGPLGEGPPDSSLVVNALREGVAPEKFTPADQMMSEVAPAAVKGAEPALEAGKPIALPPGGKRVLRLAVPLDPRPGTWRVVLQLEAAILDEAGAAVGRCEVHSNPVVFRS